jgi:hypothetical protein
MAIPEARARREGKSVRKIGVASDFQVFGRKSEATPIFHTGLVSL